MVSLCSVLAVVIFSVNDGLAEEAARVSECGPEMWVQVSDSVASAVITPEGGTLVLPGFATVEVPAGAFGAAREVTLQATSALGERDVFKVGYRYPPADHEIRILTGERKPSGPIRVILSVPRGYVRSLPEERTVDLYARTVTGRPDEAHDKYIRLASSYDAEERQVSATLESWTFHRRRQGYEAVIMVGARLKSSDHEP